MARSGGFHKGRFFLAALLGCTALGAPHGDVVAAPKAVSANSSWSVSRIASVAQGNYCTMAQKYDNNSVLSLARNASGAYSLALDFQSPVFAEKGDEVISLKAGSGKAQSFKVVPQSQQVAVISLGADENFIKALEKSATLDVEFSGQSLTYQMEKFKDGRTSLMTCMSSAAQAPAPQTGAEIARQSEDAPEVVVDSKKGNKTEKGSKPEIAAAPVSASAASPSVEGLLAAKAAPMMTAQALSSIETSAPVGKVEQERVAQIEPAAESQPEAKPEAVKAKDMPHQETAKPVEKEKPQTETVSLDSRKINALIAENAKLKEELGASRQDFESKLADVQKNTQNASADGKESADRLQSLEKENAALKAQIKAASDRAGQLAAQAAQNQQADTDAEKLRADLQDLHAQYDMLAKEKATLQTRYEQIQKEAESGQLKVAGGNWDLEQATRRYQESQREIRRLGALLEDERLKCSAEKKEIEMMLFDPKIADKAQIAQLNTLQDQVAERDSRIKEMEGKLASLQKQEQNPADDQQLAVLKKNLSETEQKMNDAVLAREAAQKQLASLQQEVDGLKKSAASVSSASAQNSEKAQAELTDLKNQLAAREKETSALQTQLVALKETGEGAKAAQSELSKKESDLIALKNELAAREKTVATLQSELSALKASGDQVQLAQSALSQKDADLAALKAQIAERDTKLAALQTQISAATKATADLTAFKAQIAERDAKLAALQSQISASTKATADMQVLQASTKSNEEMISSLKAELLEKSSKLGEAEARLIQLQGQVAQNDAKDAADQASVAGMTTVIKQGQARIGQLESQVRDLQQKLSVASMAATAPAAAPVAPAVREAAYVAPVSTVAPATPSPAAPAVSFPAINDYTDLLSASGVTVVGPLSEIKGSDPSGYRAYSWKTDSLFGSVEMRRADNGSASFDTIVSQYLARAKSRCQGDFAAVPAITRAPSMEKSASYEIACVGQNGASSSASVLFTYGHGIVSTVAHEGRAEAMDLAMDARDKLAGAVR